MSSECDIPLDLPIRTPPTENVTLHKELNGDGVCWGLGGQCWHNVSQQVKSMTSGNMEHVVIKPEHQSIHLSIWASIVLQLTEQPLTSEQENHVLN